MSDIPVDLQGLVEYLRVLQLDETKIPTVEETRKAYKALLMSHPDKNLDKPQESTKVFQCIQEAYRIVTLFLADHCDHQDATTGSNNKDDDQALLEMLESKKRLKYNKDSVTFVLDNDKGEAWISVMEKKMAAPRDPITDRSNRTIGYKMKNDKVKIPYTGVDVSVTVSIWPNPSDGVSKMLIQGRGYWSFVMCVLPSIIRSMTQVNAAMTGMSPPPDPQLSDKTSPLKATPSCSSVEGNPASGQSGPGAGTTPGVSTQPPTQPVAVSAKLSEAIVKIEKAVIDLGSNLSERLSLIENKVNKMQDSCPSNQSVTKLTESVTALSGCLSDSVRDIKSSCQSVSEVTVTLTDDDLTSLSNKVAENTVPELQKIVSDNQATLDSKVKTLSENVNKVETELSGATKEIANLSKHLSGLPTLVTSLQGMITNPGARLATPQPSVSGSETTGGGAKESTPSDIAGPKTRKGVIFTTSLGKTSDIKRLEKDLNCKLEVHVVYYVEQVSQGAAVDDHLLSKVESVMSTEVDFVILQMGSNEMSTIDLTLSRKDLFEVIQTDCEKLIKIAKTMVDRYDVDVFLSEKPPRYDKKNIESNGLLEDLNSTSNSVIKTHTHLLDRVHHVSQTLLECKGERARNERYQADGIHLTEKGVMFLNNNWVDQIRRVFTDLSARPRNPPPGTDGRGRGGGGPGGYGGGRGGGGYGRGGHSDGHDRDYVPRYNNQRNRGGYGYPRQGQDFRQEYRGNSGNRRRGNQGGGRNDLINEMIAAYIQRGDK